MDTEMKELNIYQKISVLQDIVKVNKDKVNEFANFKYRTIQNILEEVKPTLKDLDLIIHFGSGKLDGEKYILDMVITDINKPDNQIIETGEIYIDRTKAKMDLSQKCLSAKTFLKKTMLEDLLLISEDTDPDSHDNRNNETIDGMKKANERIKNDYDDLVEKFKILKEKYKELESLKHSLPENTEDENNILINDKQLKLLCTLQTNAKVSDEALKNYLIKTFKIDSRKKLTIMQLENVVKKLNATIKENKKKEVS